MRGNDGSYGGCNPDCTFSDYCGDGVVSATEECDWGADAESYGEGKCTTACRFAPYCGDGRVDVTFGEQCDDGPNPCVRGRGGCRECQYPLD